MSTPGAVRKIHRQGLPCHYCGVAPGITTDHIIPQVLGGPNTMWNLVAACAKCNGEKRGNWPTCECQKCQDAVINFCSTPDLYRKALDILGGREGVIEESIVGIKMRLAVLEQRKVSAIETYDYVKSLTDRYGFTSIQL